MWSFVHVGPPVFGPKNRRSGGRSCEVSVHAHSNSDRRNPSFAGRRKIVATGDRESDRRQSGLDHIDFDGSPSGAPAANRRARGRTRPAGSLPTLRRTGLLAVSALPHARCEVRAEPRRLTPVVASLPRSPGSAEPVGLAQFFLLAARSSAASAGSLALLAVRLPHAAESSAALPLDFPPPVSHDDSAANGDLRRCA